MSGEIQAKRGRAQQGVVIVVHRAGGFLMVRRAAGILAGGAWCFVGGAIEPGETQQEAAVREFAEEVSGRIEPQRKVWEYGRPDGKLLLHWWLAKLVSDRLQPNPLEVAELRWCTPAEIVALPGLLESNLEFVRQVGRGLAAALGNHESHERRTTRLRQGRSDNGM